ncbi:YybH family protein [Robertkochia flava]|uniref:YybH family protein n=1 Tax=Robertkochia flava TaxID=3447986 RepID=UPI001CCAEB99|nr:nuclear transport factor 2 family protein [Robertkochia marina]
MRMDSLSRLRRSTAKIGLATMFFICCSSMHAQVELDTENTVREIFAVEAAFQQMTENEGIAGAFRFFAADDAVLNRENILIKGKDAIYNYYDKERFEHVRVTWTPENVEVSKSEDLAFSYGRYQWIMTDDQGREQQLTGIYMTVWRRQENGEWRYIWD